MYQVLPPFILWCTNLRSEEVVIGKSSQGNFFVDGRHGNTELHMRTKFHLYAFYGEQVWEVKK